MGLGPRHLVGLLRGRFSSFAIAASGKRPSSANAPLTVGHGVGSCGFAHKKAPPHHPRQPSPTLSATAPPFASRTRSAWVRSRLRLCWAWVFTSLIPFRGSLPRCPSGCALGHLVRPKPGRSFPLHSFRSVPPGPALPCLPLPTLPGSSLTAGRCKKNAERKKDS
jgi:hypothetical protein